jgi:predicted LPLAT superfamily acyltransferase
MFGDSPGALQFSRHGYQVIQDYRARGGGAILLVAHLGSFEMLRSLGDRRGGLQLRVLMDHASGAKVNAALRAISPDMYDNVIDTSESDVDRVIKVKTALERGETVGLMADRYQPGERTADCRFLGDLAPFPLSPWLLAGLTQAPVLLAFALYRGGNHYELHFEKFSDHLNMARGCREARARECAQAYAMRLEHYARKAPYNWFNFYNFWHK